MIVDICCGGRTEKTSLRLALELFAQLDAESIRYCHWKSNAALDDALAGTGDLDLLVDPLASRALDALLSRLHFVRTESPIWQRQASIAHYFGRDAQTGKLLHLHVYYRLVTGGQILKNYRLPIEAQLLDRCQRLSGVRVPRPELELMLLVVRKLIEAGSLIERLLLQRDRAHVRAELSWLLTHCPNTRRRRIEAAVSALGELLPDVGADDWIDGLHVLESNRPVAAMVPAGRRCRRQLKALALRAPSAATVQTSARLAARLIARQLPQPPRKRLALAGRVVAVVGPEASGKSTLTGQTARWLGQAFDAQSIHLGKPRSSLTGHLADGLRAARRWWRTARKRSTVGSPQPAKRPTGPIRPSLAYGLTSVLLARDRYRSAVRAFRRAGRGHIVLCDRYPQKTVGGIDGPRLPSLDTAARCPAWYRWLVARERAYYRRIPAPDLTIELNVSLDVSQRRNADRDKVGKESSLDMARRYWQFHAIRSWPGPVLQVDTNRGLERTRQEMQKTVWNFLVERNASG